VSTTLPLLRGTVADPVMTVCYLEQHYVRLSSRSADLFASTSERENDRGRNVEIDEKANVHDIHVK
jgi:hypothetical protein